MCTGRVTSKARKALLFLFLCHIIPVPLLPETLMPPQRTLSIIKPLLKPPMVLKADNQSLNTFSGIFFNSEFAATIHRDPVMEERMHLVKSS